jgi:7-keto-8-aminopelargonate synthetase-like enzyme
MTQVTFTNENKNFVNVKGATTKDEAVNAADSFLEEYGMCVKNSAFFYGNSDKADEIETFNVG